MKITKLKSALLSLVLLATVCFCSTALTGCGSLDKAGVYQGDQFLYTVDTTVATAYDTLDTFTKWEYDHRAALATTPDIRKIADEFRVHAPTWFASVIALRNAYVGDPNSANRDALQKSIDILRQAIASANNHLVLRSGPPTQ